MLKEILAAISEDREDRTGERDFEFDRQINHGSDEDLMDLLAEMGY